MIYISDTSRTITIPKTRELSGDLNLRVTNILTGVTTVFAVVNSSTNPYIYKVVLSLAQVTRLDYGEYVYELLVGEAVAGQGLLRKPKVYNADTAYTNIEPNIVYGGNSGTVTRYRVVISASLGCSIVVNGESYETFDRNVQEDTILVVTANPEPGYDFITWSDGVEDQTRTIIVESDVNLYASVEAETYQVTITAGDHGTVSVNGIVGDYVQTVPYGTVLNVEAIPDTGYDFTQWSDGNTNATRTITVTEDITLTSTYATEVYQVTITAGEHCSITVNGVPGNYSARVAYGTQLTLVATPDTGYDFTGWSDGDASSSRTIIVDSDTSLTTATQIQSFTVNIMSSDNQEGLVVVNGTPGDYITHVNYGTVLTLTTQPTTGYDFLMWSDGVIADQRTITVTQDITLRATFAVQVMNVSITAGDHGTVSVNGIVGDYVQTVPYGTALNVEAVPDSHYHFTQWSDGSTSTTKTLNVTSDVTLTGSFAVDQYQVTLSAGANGSISVNGTTVVGTYSQLLDYGTVLVVEATPDQDYAFNGWSDGSSVNPRTITVTGSVALSAAFQEVFVQNNRQIVYTSVSGQTITPSGDAYDANDNALTVVSNDYSRGFGIVTYSGDIYKLGDRMYENNTDLQTVTVPDGVNQIGEYCFSGCSNMTNVYFGENSTLEHIWGYGFAGTALESIVLPDSFVDWANWIFDGVTTLDYIHIPRLPQDMEWYSMDAFAGFDTYNGVLETSIYSEGYYYSEFCVNRLVNDYGWTFKYIEKFVLVSAGGNCTEYNTSSLVAYDADNNPLTVSKIYYGCGNTMFSFSGDVAYIDGLANSNISSNMYIRKVIISLPTLTEIGDAMFTGCHNLGEITITNTTAPVVHSNTFKMVAPNGTLNYPATSDYSTWLSTNDYYLGYYNWNNVLGNSNVIYLKSSNSNLAIDAQYLKDSNDNQVSLQSHSYDGLWHKFVMDRQFAKISDGTSSAGWIDPAYRSSVEQIKFTYTPYITSIGDYQWSGFNNLNYGDDNIELFTGVTTLGDYGFSGSKLAYNHGFNSLTTIGVGAFKNARLLSTTISGTFTRIEDEAFLFDNTPTWDSSSLNITPSSFITYIGHNAFGGFGSYYPWRLAIIPTSDAVIETDAIKSGISNRGYVTIPKTFTALDTLVAGTDANVSYFDEIVYTTTDNNPISAYCCEYSNLYDSVNNIGYGLYDGNGDDIYRYNSNLASVVIYGRASNNIFAQCSNLANADFNNCTYIGSEAFDGTALVNIYIPATLTDIQERPFRCDFKTLRVDANNTTWSDGGCNALIELDDNRNYSKIITIANTNQPPAGITSFAGWFASGTDRSMALVVPASATVGFVECCWFENCNLNSFIYDGDPSQWSGNIVEGMGIPHYVYQQYISDCRNTWPDETWYVRPAANQIAYITSDRTAITPDISTSSQDSNGNQLVVASNTYNDQGLLTFTEDIYKLSYFTSADKSKITAVVLPDGINEITYDAFEGASINSLVVPGTVNTLSLQCVRNTNVESLCVPDSVVNAVASTIYGYYGKNIYFGSGVRYSTANNTFNGSILNGPNLESVDISYNNPYYYTIPGSNALFRVSDDVMVAGGICTTIPEGVTELAREAYNYNGYLTTVTIPSTVTTIGNYCFTNCTHLTEIICLATTAPTIGTGVFNFSQSGILKVPTGSNYSTWLSALPSGWTVQYIAV